MPRLTSALGLVLIGGIVLTAGAASPHAQTRDFAALVTAYRTGDADGAIRQLATWSPSQIAGADPHLAPEDKWGQLAAALLMFEATESAPGPSLQAMTQLSKQALQSVADLCTQHFEDQRLTAACRTTIRATVGGINHHEDITHRVAKAFADDPQVQVTIGASWEYWILVIDDGGSGWWKTPEIGAEYLADSVITSHGRIFPRYATEAEASYRQALKLDPDNAEARVRLGRVSWLRDRFDDAEAQWRRVLKQVPAHPEMAYLAGLFLGQMDEQRHGPADAEPAYRSAIAAYPAGQAARAALATLLMSEGRDRDAWPVLDEGMRAGAVGTQADPWSLYDLGSDTWHFSQAVKALRAEVRK